MAFVIGASIISSPMLFAQTIHRGEKTEDFTFIRGNMTPIAIPVCPTGKVAIGTNCVDVPASSTAGAPRGSMCGSAGRDWGGGWSNRVFCGGRPLISYHDELQWMGYWAFDEYLNASWEEGYFSVTVTDYNCPNGYQFMMTAHTNYGGVSGDDIFSCVKG